MNTLYTSTAFRSMNMIAIITLSNLKKFSEYKLSMLSAKVKYNVSQVRYLLTLQFFNFYFIVRSINKLTQSNLIKPENRYFFLIYLKLIIKIMR